MARSELTPLDESYKPLIARRINNLLNIQHKKQVDLHKVTGIPSSTITGYVKGRTLPTPGNVQKMADFFNVRKSDIDPRFGNSHDNQHLNRLTDIYTQLNDHRQHKVINYASAQLREQETPSINERSIVYLDGYVSAGFGEYLLDDNKREQIEVDGHVPNHDIVVKVNGDSMEPTFTNGQILYVKKITDPAVLRNGQFVIARIGDESYVKKFHKEGDQIRLISLNPKYKDIIIKPEDDFEIIGTVII